MTTATLTDTLQERWRGFHWKPGIVFKGGSGSGHFGHEGRPGEVGGSGEGGGGGEPSRTVNVPVKEMSKFKAASVQKALKQFNPAMLEGIKEIKEVDYVEGMKNAVVGYHFDDRSIEMSRRHSAATDNSINVIKQISHEVGHHIWETKMSGGQRSEFKALMKSSPHPSGPQGQRMMGGYFSEAEEFFSEAVSNKAIGQYKYGGASRYIEKAGVFSVSETDRNLWKKKEFSQTKSVPAPTPSGGHTKPLTTDERELRQALQRAMKAQLSEVHAKVQAGQKLKAVDVDTRAWDKRVIDETRPAWYRSFKKGGDKALRQVRTRKGEAVEFVTKGGQGSGNFGHEGRPGEVGGSGAGGGEDGGGDLSELKNKFSNSQVTSSIEPNPSLADKIQNAVLDVDRDLDRAVGAFADSDHSSEKYEQFVNEVNSVTSVFKEQSDGETNFNAMVEFSSGGYGKELSESIYVIYEVTRNSDAEDYFSTGTVRYSRHPETKSLKAVNPSIIIPEWLDDPTVLDALEREMFKFAHGINSTTADSLREQLMDGMEAGETTDQLADRISGVSDEWVEGWRSEMIARTESARAFSEGRVEAWKSTGVVSEKVWVAAGDCCPICAELNGTVIGLDENFYDQGDEMESEWRGHEVSMTNDYSDMGGPPAHPNCRCALVGRLSEKGMVVLEKNLKQITNRENSEA